MYFPLFVGFCACLCFVMHCFVSILVLQPSWRGRESWLLCYYFLTDVLLLLINVLWIFLVVPWVGLQFVIMIFLDHTHFLRKIRSWVIPQLAFTFVLVVLACGSTCNLCGDAYETPTHFLLECNMRHYMRVYVQPIVAVRESLCVSGYPYPRRRAGQVD